MVAISTMNPLLSCGEFARGGTVLLLRSSGTVVRAVVRTVVRVVALAVALTVVGVASLVCQVASATSSASRSSASSPASLLGSSKPSQRLSHTLDAPHSLSFKRLGIEDGLSQGTVLAILQDHEGFLWFATQDGLNRYDGYGFTVFRNDPNDESSLQNNWITDLYQSASGRLWAISRSGLSLYNPVFHSFTNFAADASLPRTRRLLSGAVTCWHEDTHGVLWIGSDKGLHAVHPPHNTLEIVSQPLAKDGVLPMTKIFALLQDRSGKLWAATAQGLYWAELPRGSSLQGSERVPSDATAHTTSGTTPIVWKRVSAAHLQQQCTALFEDSAGRLWVGVANVSDRSKPEYGIVEYRPAQNSAILHNHASILPAAQRYKSGVVAIKADHVGRLWVRMNEGLLRLNTQSNNVLQSAQVMLHNPQDSSSLSSNTVSAMFEDNIGIMWIGTIDGLDAYNAKTNAFVHFKYHPGSSQSLSYNVVRSMYQDRSGTLWFGVDVGGVSSWHPARQRFMLYRRMPFTNNTLSDNSVRAFVENPDGTMWIGTDKGLNLFDRTTERWRTFTANTDSTKNAHELKSNDIRSLYRDRDGILWIGTNSTGLQRYMPQTGRFEHFPFRPEDSTAFPSDRVRSILQDRAGRIWISCHVAAGGIPNTGGLVLYHPKTRTFTRFLHNPADSTSLSHNEARCLHEDKRGTLWVGTYKGLNVLLPGKHGFVRYFHRAADTTSLSSNIICCIYEDSAGRIWIATANGLNEFHPNTQTFTRYTTREGLPNNFVYGILEDEFGLLWLSTNKGLSRFDPKTKQFRNYGIGDGLQSDEFNSGAFLKTANGDLWFGGVNGFNIVTPKLMSDNPHVSPIVLTAFTVLNKPRFFDQPLNAFVRRANSPATRSIVLKHDENLIAVEFAALDFINPANSEYMYKLDGIDATWVRSGKRRFASYSQLEPGEYTFRIRACNSDGVWDMEGVALSIVITPPFWKTWWFRLFVLASVVASAWAWHTLRLRAVEARNRLLKQLVDERTVELRRKNEELVAADEEIRAQNEELQRTNQELLAADEEIRRKNTILEEQAAHIELTNTELQQKNDDLKTMNKQLEEYSKELHRNSEILAHQAQEIELINTELQHKNLELADANVQLEALNKRKNELIGVVAHDLKNPLAAIMMASSMVERYLDRMRREDLLKHVSNIKTTSERMNKIILDLLDVEAIESGKFNLTLEMVNITQAAQATLNDYAPHADRKAITLHFEPAEQLYAFADNGAVRQILDNLVSNAIKYSPPGKHVWVIISREESSTLSLHAVRQGALIQNAESNRRVQIIVKDEGPGLSKEDQQKLFGRFAKLTPRPTAGEHSTGLGLSIVKQLVEAMNGRVWCESELGQGTAFIVELPEGQSKDN
jgi:ligand-binding sensor domain-containing protein/signal transduction histidine kinase